MIFFKTVINLIYQLHCCMFSNVPFENQTAFFQKKKISIAVK